MVRVSANSEALTQEIVLGEKSEFYLTADEPVNVGGRNKGPTPYELILSALGSCMSMTMFIYSQRKDWPLKNVEIELNHKRVYAKDCVECETKTGMLDEIDVRIKLTGDLTSDQRQSIFAIAKRCPVHNTLTKEVMIRNQLD